MEEFVSQNPSTQEILWKGAPSTADEIDAAFKKAKTAQISWRKLSIEKRQSYLIDFQNVLKKERENFAVAISRETGKPLWESLTEVDAMIGKIPLTIDAYNERCKIKREKTEKGELVTWHRPHGTVAVFGPFNFPGHLPNSHIVPALLAGNTLVFKGSEHTPLVSEMLFNCWKKSGLPDGVLHLIQGGPDVGKIVASHPLVDGLFFTGSSNAGSSLLQQFAMHPEKILALEMGGNNPLVLNDFKDADKTIDLIIQSAFLTAGQRCSCARRLIVIESKENQLLLDALVKKMLALHIGDFNLRPEPFMGPLIDLKSAKNALDFQENLLKQGGKALTPMRQLENNKPFLTPGLIEVTESVDRECFGPLLQVLRVKNFEEALVEANKTRFGLTAGLISKSEEKYNQFLDVVKAGVVNWNVSLTGASGKAPFGGLGWSGNHRASGYFAVDYCSSPVATQRGL